MPEITKFLEEQIYRTGGFEGYTPLGSKYMDIHRSPAVERWDISGNRKGKTAEFIVEDCWDATGAGPKYYHEARPPKLPNHGRIVATNFNDGVMKVILPELRKWIPKKFLLGGSWEDQLRFDSGTQDFSVVVWVRMDLGIGVPQFIISKEDVGNDGWVMRTTPTGQLVGSLNAVDATSTGIVADGLWHVAIMVVDRSVGIQLYLDGIPDGAAASVAAAMATTATPRIGADSYFGWNPLNGDVAGLFIIPRVLSAAECFDIAGRSDRSVVNGVEGYWKLDETAGVDVLDSSDNANDGINTDAAINQAGVVGTSYKFDGISAVVTVPDIPQISAQIPMSAALWVKRNSVGGRDELLFKRGPFNYGWFWRIATDDFMRFHFGGVSGGDGAATTAISDTDWHHVVVTVDAAGDYVFYIDATPAGTGNVGSPTVSGSVLRMGVFVDTVGLIDYYSDTTLDDVRIYSRALSQADINCLFAYRG